MNYIVCLSTLLLLGLLGIADAAQPKADSDRQIWLYKIGAKRGSFQVGTGKQWLETTPDKDQHAFREVGRTPRYVELFDRARMIGLRLYADHADWRRGEKGPWGRLYDGRWGKPDDLPRPVKRDYRIRLAYFVPTDRKPVADYEKKIAVVMQVVAEVYRQDFESRGIKSKGLRFQMSKGEPVVHLIRGKRNAAFYNDAPGYDVQNQWKQIIPEIPASVGVPTQNVIIVFTETYDPGPAKYEWPGGVALGGRMSTDGGVGIFSSWILRKEFCATTIEKQKKMIFDTTPIKGRVALGNGKMNSPRFEFIEDGFGAVAHELGHALGLPHDNRRDDLYIMGNGFRNLRFNFLPRPDPERRARFSDDNARILYTSRYLAPDFVSTDQLAPTVTFRFAETPKAGDTKVKATFTAVDETGLRAALVYSYAQDSVVGGRALRGKRQTFTEELNVRPLKPGPYRLEIFVADDGGNLTRVQATANIK